MPDKDRILRLLGLTGNGDAGLRSLVERHSILLGKLIGEVGSGNVLYGIEAPETDVATHAAIVAAHHAKYLDSAALAAIAGAGLYIRKDGSIAFTGVVVGVLPTLSAHLATKEYVDSAIHFVGEYFLNNSSSDIGGIYYKMLDTPTGDAQSTFQSGSLGEGEDQALVNFATDANIPGVIVLEAGVYGAHIHARVTLSNKRPVKLHFELYSRTTGGSETLVATSEESPFLTTSDTEYDLHANVSAEVVIATTDRLVLKWLANVDATPSSDVIVELFAEGNDNARFSIPLTTDVLNQVFLRQDGTKELSGNMSVASGVTIDGVDISADIVLKALFNANTILAANSDNTPAALTIAASRILGRKSSGNIGALTGAEILAILSGQAGANFAWNSKKLTGVVDPTSNQDVATKKYVDDNVGGGAGSLTTIKENDTPVGDADIEILDFLGADFDLTENPNKEIQIVIAAAIARVSALHDQAHGSGQHSAESDAEAIHDNKSGEIAAITEKATPVNADLIIIEDSAASNAKKRVQVGNLPGGGNGGISHALAGALYPSVLSTGVKSPQIEYRGDAWTLTELSCRVAVAAAGAALKVRIRRNGSSMGEVDLGTTQTGVVTGLSINVADKDYFDIEITQVGTNPNEGQDLHWQVLP